MPYAEIQYAVWREQYAVSGDAICHMQRYNMPYAESNMPYPVMQYAVCRDTICHIREQYVVSESNMPYSVMQYAVCREEYAVSGDAICRVW